MDRSQPTSARSGRLASATLDIVLTMATIVALLLAGGAEAPTTPPNAGAAAPTSASAGPGSAILIHYHGTRDGSTERNTKYTLLSSVKTPRDTVGAMTAIPLSDFKLMNYYPATAAWSNMWIDWDPTVINSDFATIHSMSANVVRLIIPPAAFGFPVPSTTQKDHLREAIQLATQNDLHVQLTLFDWFTDYADVIGSTTWLRDVVGPYASDPAIAFIELRNEVAATNPTVASWITSMFPVLKQVAGSVPVTVSVSLTPELTQLHALQSVLRATPPSFYDVHAYGTPGVIAAEVQAAQQSVAPAPMFVGETGDSTYTADTSDRALSDTYQAYFYQAVEWSVQQLQLPPAAPWTFTDFTSSAVPSGTTTPPEQYYYGLYRTNGSPKPAAGVITRLFSDGTVDTGFNNNFSVGANGTPALWTASCLNGSTTRWDASGGYGGGGTVSLGDTKPLFATAASGSRRVCWPSYFVQPITGSLVHPSARFAASVDAMGDASTGTNVIQIAWFNAAGQYISNSSSAPLPAGSTSWTELSVTSAAPVHASYAQIYLASADNAGMVTFSNVRWSPAS